MSHLTPILNKKVEALEEMQKCENRIIQLKNEIDKINKELYEKCTHLWIRDDACSDDDLGKNYCKNCGLRYYHNYK
jgi:hypothetical protein